jgi:hypothetical protein
VGPDARSLYVVAYDTDSGQGTVRQYNIDAQGRLSPKSPTSVEAGSNARTLAVSPDGRSLYVGAFSTDDQPDGIVLQYDIDTRGRLSPKSPATADPTGSPSDLAVRPDGRSVYATIAGTAVPSRSYGQVSQFDVDAQGRLSPKSPAIAGVDEVNTDVVVSPNGRYAFVTYGHGGGVLTSYPIGAQGRLSPAVNYCCSSPFYPRSPSVSPDGKSVYANGAPISPGGDQGLFQVDIRADGELSTKDPPSVSGTVGALVVSPDGRSLYALKDGGIGQFDIGQGGLLARKLPFTVPAADYPKSIVVSPDTASAKVSGKTLIFSAPRGAPDHVRITRPNSSTLRIADTPSFPYTGAPLHAGSGCTSSGPYVVNCHGEIARVQVTVGDRADRVVNSTGVQSSLYGEDGSDVLIGGRGKDIVVGGGNPDVMKGGNGNDRLLAHDHTSDTTINCDGGIGTPGHADSAELDRLPKDPNSVISGCETKTRH